MIYTHACSSQICMWNIATGDCVNEIMCHTDTIYSIAFNWDGSLMATTSKDKKLRVIDPRTGTVVSEAKVLCPCIHTRVLTVVGTRRNQGLTSLLDWYHGQALHHWFQQDERTSARHLGPGTTI